MILTNANTEGYLQFHRSHEHLNRTTKILVIGLGLASEAVRAHRTPEDIKQLLYKLGWLWGGMPDWSEPDALIEEARLDIGRSGVMRAFSAFDLFLDHTDADLASWSQTCIQRGLAEPPNTSSDNWQSGTTSDTTADRLDRFYQRIGANRGKIDFAWPVYRYFRLARDCIAHRRALVSPALAEISKSNAVKGAVDSWRDHTDELDIPEIPSLDVDEPIGFTHRQAILSSSILRIIASDVNLAVLNLLGPKGVVYLAARRTLLDLSPLIDVSNTQSTEAAIHFVLSSRYRVSGLDASETRGILRDLDIWQQCQQRFEILSQASTQET